MQSVKDSRASVTLWAEGRTGFVCSCCGHPDPQIWLTRSSPAEQKQSKTEQMKHLSSIYRREEALDSQVAPLESPSLRSNNATVKSTRHSEFSCCLNNSQVRVLLPLIKHFQWGCHNAAVQRTSTPPGRCGGGRFCFYVVAEVIRALWPWKVLPLRFTHPSISSSYVKLA